MIERCVIFAGGDTVSSEAVDLDFVKDSYVICADKGLELAEKFGITSDLILGDFDSLGCRPEGSNVMSFPVEKDDTDLMLAVKTGLDKGFTDFIIYGACGGRADHFLGNISCLSLITDNNANGMIIGDDDIISMHDAGTYSFEYKEGFSMSLLAYSSTVSGLTVSGTKYTAQNCILSRSVTLGISNEITSDHAEVSFSNGRLLVIRSRIR